MCVTDDFNHTAWSLSAPSFLFAHFISQGRRDCPRHYHRRVLASQDNDYYTITTETPLFVIPSTDTASEAKTVAACANEGIVAKHSLQSMDDDMRLVKEIETWSEEVMTVEQNFRNLDPASDDFSAECDKREADYLRDLDLQQRMIDDQVIISGQSGMGNRCLGERTLIQMFLMAFSVGLQECQNPQCLRRKRAFARSAPSCDWAPFRDLVLQILGCWMPKMLLTLRDLLILSPKGAVTVCLDLHGVFYLFRWARRLVFGDEIGENIHRKGTSHYDETILKLLAPGHERTALDISRECRDRGICPNRLWNLSIQSVLGVGDIPYIAEVALDMEWHRGDSLKDDHRTCNEQSCIYNDVNNTSVEQIHKQSCPGQCQDIIFPLGELDSAFNQPEAHMADGEWRPTAWLLPDAPLTRSSFKVSALCNPESLNYIAISHVWSDGTGTGIKAPGLINECLARYFIDIAHTLGCQGLWWDAICIPRERKARRTAIDTMLENYERAAFTVIHDQDLVDFEWKDDGSPAIALILSSWFTRGWTAAELFSSRRHPVKVIFKNPNGSTPLLKDLDQDILARNISTSENGLQNFNPDTISRLGHYLVTDIFSHFRSSLHRPNRLSTHLSSDIGIDLRSLLRLMRGRVTSWARDRMIISGLICLPRHVTLSSLTGPDITKKLILHFGSVYFEDLLHASVPIRQLGPWSWCPPSIFDIGLFSSLNTYRSHIRSPTSIQFEVSDAGAITTKSRSGILAYTVLEGDVLMPAGSHPSIRARVSEALVKKKHCLLLTDREILNDGRLYILCMPIKTYGLEATNITVIHCSWIGCVYLNTGTLSRTEIISSFPVQLKLGVDDDHHHTTIEVEYVREYIRRVSDGARQTQDQGERNAVIYLSQWSEDELTEKSSVQAKRVWMPQPAKLHISSPGLYRRTQRSNERSTSMIVDLQTWENKIAISTVLEVRALGNNFRPCRNTHEFPCGGQVELVWELVCPLIGGVERQIPQKPLFVSTFHVVAQVLSSGFVTGISIGRDGFNQHLKRFSRILSDNILDGKKSTSVAILLASSVQESSMAWGRWEEETQVVVEEMA